MTHHDTTRRTEQLLTIYPLREATIFKSMHHTSHMTVPLRSASHVSGCGQLRGLRRPERAVEARRAAAAFGWTEGRRTAGFLTAAAAAEFARLDSARARRRACDLLRLWRSSSCSERRRWCSSTRRSYSALRRRLSRDFRRRVLFSECRLRLRAGRLVALRSRQNRRWNRR